MANNEVPKLSAAQKQKVLEKLRAHTKKMDSIPPSQKNLISKPGKYDFPLGRDEKGNPLPPSKDAIKPPITLKKQRVP